MDGENGLWVELFFVWIILWVKVGVNCVLLYLSSFYGDFLLGNLDILIKNCICCLLINFINICRVEIMGIYYWV